MALASTAFVSNWNSEMSVLCREENLRTQRKKPWNRDENQQQSQPTCDDISGNQTWDTLVGSKCSHYYTISAPGIIMKNR